MKSCMAISWWVSKWMNLNWFSATLIGCHGLYLPPRFVSQLFDVVLLTFCLLHSKKVLSSINPKKKKIWSLVAYDYYFLLVRFLGKNDTRERKKRDVIHFLQFFKLALMHSFLRFRLSHAVCHCGKSSRTSCHFYTCE